VSEQSFPTNNQGIQQGTTDLRRQKADGRGKTDEIRDHGGASTTNPKAKESMASPRTEHTRGSRREGGEKIIPS